MYKEFFLYGEPAAPDFAYEILKGNREGRKIPTQSLGYNTKLCKETVRRRRRLNDISALPDKDREHILYTIDGLIKSAKLQAL